MGKTITINQNSLLAIKESMVGINDVSHNNVCVNEAAPEVDEFELGQESDNPPVGGNYCHVEEEKLVTESKNSSRAHRQTRQIIARTLGTDENDPSVIKAEREFEAKMFGEGKRVDWMIVLEPLAYDWYLQCGNMNAVKGYLDYIYLKGTESTPPSAYIADIKQFVDFNELKQFLDQQKKADDATSMEAQANMEVNLNQNYEVRGPLSFEEAREIGEYSNPNGQICYTQDEGIWDGDSYSNNDINSCYVLLRNGWQKVEANHDGSESNNGLPSPLNQFNGYDSYGLSMIFVWIGRFGNLVVSNTRWNHDADYAPGHGVDYALTELDIARLMGAPFEQVFGVKKIDIDDYVQKGLDSHMDIQDIFDEVYDEYCGLRCVKIGSKYNYVASENRTLYGFDYKYLYLLWDKPYDEWFEDATDFNRETNLGTVEVNGKTYFIDKYAKLYDVAETTKKWLADGKTDMFLDVCGDGAIVRVTYDYIKFNYVNTNDKKLLWDKPYEEWFGFGRRFRPYYDDYVLVKLNDDLYFFDVNGNLSDITETVKKRLKTENPLYIFDTVENYGVHSYDIHMVELFHKYNFINIKTDELLWDKPYDNWFDAADSFGFFSQDIAKVEIGKKHYFLNKLGQLIDKYGNMVEENKILHKDTLSINEGYLRNRLSSIDLSEVGRVNYSFDFDEDEYNEWLAENGLQDSEETRYEFYKDQWEYEVEYLDNDTLHYMEGDSGLSYDDLEDLFGENMAETIVRTCMKDGSGYFETDDLYADEQVDVNNPQELDAFAMKLLRHGEYFKGCRGFILSNGVVIYTEAEHNEVLRIPGINSKFQFIELGNIRLLPNSIDIGAEPTPQQEQVLRQVIASYDGEELYLDIFTNGGDIGVKYPRADYHYVLGEIDRFYSEGIRPQGGGFYENKDGKKTVDENVDLEVDASEIDLSSFKKRSELAPIWEDGDTLDSRVRLRLLDIADDFWEFVNLTWVSPSGIILTGSICNFNWSKYSDIDLHLIVDFDEIDEKTEFVQDYLDSKKNEWNNEHSDLTILGFPVELYVQNLGDMPKSGGVYDLEENAWLKKPNASDIKPIGLDKFSIKDKAAEIMTIIDDMYNALSSEDDMHRIEEIGEDAHYLWKKVRDMRQTSLEKNGESGAGNIVYKILRRMDYLDKLWKLSTLTYDKTNSIEEGKKIYISEDKLMLLGETQESNATKFDDGIFELAKKHFGVTRDIRECGYILPDGSMLDFSGRHTLNPNTDSSHLRGRRGIDHREIYEIGWDKSCDVKNFDLTMEDFIRAGAVRVHVSSKYCSVNLYQKPTDSQIQVLMNIIRYAKGCVDVEIGDGNESLSYAEYDGVNARKPISDILRYFDEGISLVNESKEVLNEYLDKNYNLPLYKYFKWASTASDVEKVEDIIYTCSYGAKNYIERKATMSTEFEMLAEKLEEDEDIIFYDDDFVEEIANAIVNNNLTENFIYYIETSYGENELPSWVFMDFNRIVKNEWCIHFGPDSEAIANEGFTGGTEEIERLAYTGAGQQKPSAGYDFAFPLGERDIDYNNYGKEAVIFQTSGIEIYHHGDNQNQVIFWGPEAKNFIPIKYDGEVGDWCIYGKNGQVLKSGDPSDILDWAINNLPQYRKQIMAGKNGYIPMMSRWNNETNKYERKPYPIYRNESVKKYLTLLKEETVADGSSTSNPYKKRWKAEREALKNFVANYGKLMQSKEDDKGGKLYKVFYDKTMSELIGYNYCVAVQYDEINNKPKSTVYVRALDKFTPFIRRSLQYDTRGKDNQIGTMDDLNNRRY